MNLESEFKVQESKFKKSLSILLWAGVITFAFGVFRSGKFELKTIIVDFALLLVVFVIFQLITFRKKKREIYFSSLGLKIIDPNKEKVMFEWQELEMNPKIYISGITSRTIEIWNVKDKEKNIT